MDILWKSLLLILLITLSLKCFAYREIHAKNMEVYCCSYSPTSTVRYYGPDCNGYYHGSDCSKVVWIGDHWDIYGHYIRGHWLALNR